MSTESELSSVERALLLLEILLEQPEGADISEMLTRIEISRSSLFVLLNTLKTLGYVGQAEKRGRYHAGPRLLAWRNGNVLFPKLQAAFYQEASTLELPETLALALPFSTGALLVAQVEGKAQVRSVFTAARRFTTESAPALVLMPSPPPRVLQTGYAMSNEIESTELALPICRDGQTPSAALVLSVPSFRWSSERLNDYLPILRELAARLSYRLGALRYTPWKNPTLESPIQRRALDDAQITAFLGGPWIARLACLRPDGTPHVVPVWQEWDGQYFYITAWQGSLWAEYVRSNPSVSLTVDEPWPPLRRVLVRGIAQSLSKAEVPHLLRRLQRRYLGQHSPLPEVEWQAFRITPDWLSASQGLA